MKTRTSNFKLHLGLLIVKMLYKKISLSFEEIANINIEQIDVDLFNETINFLNNSIDSYLTSNSNKNLINIAKSKDFTVYLLTQLDSRFSNSQ